MSEEIKVGEYIRTNKGTMGQIIEKRLGKFFKGKDDDEIPILRNVYELDNKQWTTDEYIVKHSKKPIELVEVGDIVNGCVVVLEKYTYIEMNFINVDSEISYGWGTGAIPEHEIKTILTHEMYEQNSYKVGDIEW